MRAETKGKHQIRKRFAIVIGVAAVGVMALGAQTGAHHLPAITPGQAPPTCLGFAATIVGTSGNDALHGTPGHDVIVGRGGGDSLKAKRGNDVLCGGAGKDTLKGGKGNDNLFGGGAHDRIFGGGGNDELDGQAGNDTLNGGRGPKDFCVGGNGNDSPELPASPPSSFQPVSGCEQRSIH
jgi:Ca2+-binding RTX toxin-like protein